MKKFITRILYFSFVLFLIFMIGLMLPATPKVSESMLYLKNDKDSLLANTQSPRIIFIGESGLLLGINSQMIYDSLKLNPINASLYWGIGLIYMIDNAIGYIKSGDIVVVSADYNEFYDNLAYGRKELLWTVMDISPSSLWKLRGKQWEQIIPFLSSYSFTKFVISEYWLINEKNVYNRLSCNKYGDMVSHWGLIQQEWIPLKSISGDYDSTVIYELSKFQTELKKKGAIMYLTYPAFDKTSFENSRAQIEKIEKDLKKKDFTILGTPDKNRVPDSLIFDGASHLTKAGCDYRTQLLIEEIKVQMYKQ